MNLKEFLYFGLGLSALVPFAARFFIQWILSEKKKESHVTGIFWILSIFGNVLMSMHYLVQIQYHLYFIRIFPLYFSLRQWALIQKTAKPFSWLRLFKILAFLTLGLTLLFMLRVGLEKKHLMWIHNLQMPWQKTETQVFWLWHAFGFMGAALFASRLWVQWWQSEKRQQSVLTPTFWWLSLIGGSLTLIYALMISDYVTACGYVTGLIPYARNIMLINKSKLKAPN